MGSGKNPVTRIYLPGEQFDLHIGVLVDQQGGVYLSLDLVESDHRVFHNLEYKVLSMLENPDPSSTNQVVLIFLALGG